jgi:hypothetical protein
MIKFAQIEGGAELAAVLRGLPDALARNGLRASALAGAKALQNRAYVTLSSAVKSGGPRHADDVIIKQRRSPKGEVQAVFDVGPPTRKPWLRWLHDGTKPHTIEVRKAKVLSDGDKLFGRIIHHPGQPPQPWLLQAQFTSAEAVYRAMADKLRPALSKQVKRLVSNKYRSKQLKRIFS